MTMSRIAGPAIGLLAALALGSCAVMHRSAVGERLADEGDDVRPVFVNASEYGVNTKQLAGTGSRIARSTKGKGGNSVADFIEFLTWATSQSPRTGNPTKDDLWADDITGELRRRCPNGTITGIQTTRESAEYPYVSGEIVRVRAQCIRTKKDPAQ